MSIGYWKVSMKMGNGEQVTDADLEHVAKSIKAGFTEGQLIHDNSDYKLSEDGLCEFCHRDCFNDEFCSEQEKYVNS